MLNPTFVQTNPPIWMQQNLSEFCALAKILDVFYLSKAGAFASKPLDILTRWDPTYDTKITLNSLVLSKKHMNVSAVLLQNADMSKEPRVPVRHKLF